MSKRRFMVVSGFLGAGKTTTMLALADAMAKKGVKAGLISNDLGAKNLVDAMYTADRACCSAAIAGGCICYQTETLVDRIRRFTDVEHADFVMSDIPGCGVGALDHVYFKLHREYPQDFALAPFTVVADPLRLRAIMPEHANLHLPEEMNYLFRTQLLEADVIVLNKIDTISAEERERCISFLKASYPGIPVFAVCARSGEGVGALADYLLANDARLVEVDTGYGGEAFMAAESRLSWYDCRCFVTKETPFDGNAFVADYMESVRAELAAAGKNVPHLKVMATAQGSDFAKASLIGVDYETEFDRRLDAAWPKYSVVVNARAACESQLLGELMNTALRKVVDKYGLTCRVYATECFGMTDEGV